MDKDTKLSIIRQYIVDGDSMEKIAKYNHLEISDISSIVRGYNFNID